MRNILAVAYAAYTGTAATQSMVASVAAARSGRRPAGRSVAVAVAPFPSRSTVVFSSRRKIRRIYADKYRLFLRFSRKTSAKAVTCFLRAAYVRQFACHRLLQASSLILGLPIGDPPSPLTRPPQPAKRFILVACCFSGSLVYTCRR